jgi:serine/threonine protein kinase
VVESIARGYFALFTKHIVHRDMKPQNILLLYKLPDKKERRICNAKITDFGVSRVLADEHMGLCNVAGTLLFMAPEVGANLVAISEYDHRADMWSIGCLLFQCLSGSTPFDEASLCRLFLHCACGNFDGYEVPELPPETETSLRLLICSLLQIDSTKRPTPRQLLDAAESQEVLLIQS